MRLIVITIGLQMDLIFAYTVEWISIRKRKSRSQHNNRYDHLI